MPRARSAKGEMVDFDHLKIMKNQMAAKPISIEVQARQNFIDQKLRRRVRAKVKQAAAVAGPVGPLSHIQTTEAQNLIEAPVVPTDEKVENKSTKQKIRPPKQ
jgi:hypothetical protein